MIAVRITNWENDLFILVKTSDEAHVKIIKVGQISQKYTSFIINFGDL